MAAKDYRTSTRRGRRSQQCVPRAAKAGATFAAGPGSGYLARKIRHSRVISQVFFRRADGSRLDVPPLWV